MHLERHSDVIEQIKESQDQLVELINQAVRTEDAESLEINAQNLAKKAFRDGIWPDELQPWPAMRINSSKMLRARGSLMEAMMQGVRGHLSLEIRTGGAWVWHLFDLLQIFSSVLMNLPSSISGENPVFPTEAQLWNIFYGYLYELAHGARKMFGAQTDYVRAIQSWYSDNMQSASPPLPGTRAFARRFQTAQSKLLTWAGMDKNKGIALEN